MSDHLLPQDLEQRRKAVNVASSKGVEGGMCVCMCGVCMCGMCMCGVHV